MISGFRIALAASAALMAAAAPVAVSAQTPPAAAASDWRTIAPENLLVIDTSKGRVLVELEPRAAPRHVERIRTLADRGFYDGQKFHRVIAGFMAQTGDPLGTGEGGSDLPNIPAELTFRRGRDSGFAPVANDGAGLRGIMGTLPVVTQPDAQMMVTADFKTSAQAIFCPGVAGMALYPAPLHLVQSVQRIQALPQFNVFHRLLVGRGPAACLPAVYPFGDAVLHVHAVGVDGHRTALLQGRQRLDCCRQFHAVVRRELFAAEHFFLVFTTLEPRTPAARARVAAAGAVGIDHHLIHRRAIHRWVVLSSSLISSPSRGLPRQQPLPVRAAPPRRARRRCWRWTRFPPGSRCCSG